MNKLPKSRDTRKARKKITAKRTEEKALREKQIDNNKKAIKERHEQIAKAEMKLIYDVLTEYLGREPDDADRKLCSRHFAAGQEKTGTYGLVYDNKHLGTVTLEIGEEVKIFFKPNE